MKTVGPVTSSLSGSSFVPLLPSAHVNIGVVCWVSDTTSSKQNSEHSSLGAMGHTLPQWEEIGTLSGEDFHLKLLGYCASPAVLPSKGFAVFSCAQPIMMGISGIRRVREPDFQE